MRCRRLFSRPAIPRRNGSYKKRHLRICKAGEKVLTSDWHWSPYKILAGEIGREISTYELFDGQTNSMRRVLNRACRNGLRLRSRH